MLCPKRYKQVDHTLESLCTALLDVSFAQDQWSQRYLLNLAPLQDETHSQSIFHYCPHEVISHTETFHF